MKLHQLNALATIADTGSIRAAARTLSLSPAALTKAVRELEDDMKVPLVVRNTSGISLTEFGQTLLVHARLIRTQLAQAHADIDAMRGIHHGTLSIGVTPWIALTLLAGTLKRFRDRMPNMNIEVFEGALAIVAPRLRDGGLEFSIGHPLLGTGNEFNTQPLFATTAVATCRIGHPLAGSKTLSSLLDSEWILNWDPASANEVSHKLFTRHGVSIPNTIHLVHSLSITLGLLQSTDMIAVLPAPILEVPFVKNMLVALPLDEKLYEMRAVVTSRRNTPLSPGAECFLECLKCETLEGARSAWPEKRRHLQLVDWIG
ncbi:LysR family transcriptional regulator [Burkholderia ambifaria]|uniref:LysR substrate-binding domain-containing protein n=1 Tax=Burkholderia ambifaria TaxID=152480 RepID=UPI001E42A75C|nr:LysR substrate-binding domain-containing protein [Burkholderia ambifaria]UEP23089.1 LysR family transcriptional regulator [Burkholderia ambifaria]UEP39833.1 LysR family transcriptional regulator [Burkholderia ambifaria]